MNKWITTPELHHTPFLSDITNVHYVGRPCLINGEEAIFHQFVETEQLILISDKLPLKPYTIEDHIIITNNCSVEKIKNVAARAAAWKRTSTNYSRGSFSIRNKKCIKCK